MKTAIVGANWGDEGKGRMIDLLSKDYQVVVRFQGGNNAGHTVVNDLGKFVLNLLPSGILRPEVVNVMGNGMLVDLSHLCGEIEHLRQAGVRIGPDNLKISERASVCLPFNKQQDILEEDRLGAGGFGSTRRGIAPGYADKYMKKALRMEDLRDIDALSDRLEALAEWKNLTLAKGYGAEPVSAESLKEWLKRYGEPLLPYIVNTTEYLNGAIAEGRDVLFEAQLGSLRDLDMGIYPFTTSSNTLAAYAPIGAGVPGQKLDKVIAIVKAYSSCVGAGPFCSELLNDAGDRLREAGGEYGAATGRPRRVGAFDLVATAYGVSLQGADALALTKLDVMSYMERIPVCVAYDIDGVPTRSFPSGPPLFRARPVLEYLPGFGRDISGCRSWQQLPQAARDYITFIEDALRCPIAYVSVGPERDQIIYR